MSSYHLEKYTLTELKNIASEMDIPPRRSKGEMIHDIESAFREYENYKKEKIDRYNKKYQLGSRGKEAVTYLVIDNKSGKELAMKTFRKNKSSTSIEQEYLFQKKASESGISPAVHDYDDVSKYIVMEKMDKHLLELIKNQHGKLFKYQQERIIEIFKTLDNIGIFHNDSNICNYMVNGTTIYIIDFGYARAINSHLVKKLGTNKPNSSLMLAAFILKLKEMNVVESSYKYLLKYLPEYGQQYLHKK